MPVARRIRKAFTLIELLIVVAIISIIVAIAIPNFYMEAQIRSQVSRCKADMRSVAIALESYRVDNNTYPLGVTLDRRSTLVMFSSSEPVESLVPKMITTPVAYMSRLPQDPFPAKLQDGEAPDHPFHYLDRKTEESRGVPGLIGNYSQAIRGARRANAWMLFSVGPDLEHDKDLTGTGAQYAAAIYDPTNGTVSNGDIVLFQGESFAK